MLQEDRKPTTPRDARVQRCRKRQAGMTLMELLVVITILSLLTVTAGTVALNYLGRAKSETSSLRIDQVSSGLELFYLDVGRYPTEEEGLVALVEGPAGLDDWRGPYLKKREVLEDAWGAPFLYANPGRHGEVDIYSLGADQAEGGDDDDKDVTSW